MNPKKIALTALLSAFAFGSRAEENTAFADLVNQQSYPQAGASETALSLEKKISASIRIISDSEQLNREYAARFQQIEKDVKAEKYVVIDAEITNMVQTLESYTNFVFKDRWLERAKNFSYEKTVLVEGGAELVKVKEGYYEDVWVRPEYEDKAVGPTANIFAYPVAAVKVGFGTLSFLLGQKNDSKQWFGEAYHDVAETKSVETKPGYTKQIWHEPAYETRALPPRKTRLIYCPFSRSYSTLSGAK